MAHDVFISYADPDKPIADAVCSTLERRGVRCWIAPRDVLPGEIWGKAIIEAIHGSLVMVVVFSSKSNESQQVMREVERAVNQGLVIIPFRIEAVLPSENMEYFLSSTHWLDAMTPPLESHVESLADTVQKFIERTRPQRPAPLAGPDLASDIQASRVAEEEGKAAQGAGAVPEAQEKPVAPVQPPSGGVEQAVGPGSEIRRELPPPVPLVQPRDGADSSVPLVAVEAVARLYRRLVLLVGIQLVLSPFQVLTLERYSSEGGLFQIEVLMLLSLLVAMAMAHTAYELTRRLGTDSPISWAAPMLLPFVNIVVLLALSSKAQGWCRRSGITVGFLGPTQESLDRLRQHLLTDRQLVGG
jgi:hypothetical protein